MYQDERKLDFKPLGIAIKKAREAKGWTQEYLAQLVDLTPRSIMYIENRGQHPRLNKFYLITTLLDISVDQFFFPCNEDGDNNRRKQVDVLLNDMEEKELMGILSLERVQILPQDGLSAHGVHQGDLHAGELNVSRHQVNAFRVVQDTLTGAQRLVHQDTAHRVGQSKGQLVRLGVAQADGQAALRVPVDQQHFLSSLRQPDPQVRAGGCLANAAFLVGDGDDLRVQ